IQHTNVLTSQSTSGGESWDTRGNGLLLDIWICVEDLGLDAQIESRPFQRIEIVACLGSIHERILKTEVCQVDTSGRAYPFNVGNVVRDRQTNLACDIHLSLGRSVIESEREKCEHHKSLRHPLTHD